MFKCEEKKLVNMWKMLSNGQKSILEGHIDDTIYLYVYMTAFWNIY
jgi:hypothetical protein